MPVHCAVKNCSNRFKKNSENNPKFYRIPKVNSRYPKLKNLFVERRRKWIATLNLKNFIAEYARVCSEHFISSKYLPMT